MTNKNSSKKESMRYSLMGDLDGISVSSLKEILKDYPDNSIIEVREESVYTFGDSVNPPQEYFVFVWEDDEE